VRSHARTAWMAIVVLAWCAGSIASLAVPSSVSAAPSEAEILDAIETVRADPNISPERKVRTLKWLDADEPEPRERNGWMEWLGGLFQWIGSATRLILWLGIALLLGLLGLFLKRIIGDSRYSRTAPPPHTPTHVQEMDIRPESLPEEIGAAALQLWDRNDHRAALALLYRGLLSRLVHAHGVPILQSTTEADCLSLAVPRLNADVAQYTTLLVRIWQLAVYGAREPDAHQARTLCIGFDKSFPRVAAQPSGARS